MTCYTQINQGGWCQEWYETASRNAGRRTRQLRGLGYRVAVEAMGVQGIMDAYNYDGSDPASDYFDVRFYGHAEFCSDLKERSRDEIEARFETEAAEIEADAKRKESEA